MMAVNTMAVNTGGDHDHGAQTSSLGGRTGAMPGGAVPGIEKHHRRGAVATTIADDWEVAQRDVLDACDVDRLDMSLTSTVMFSEHNHLAIPRLQRVERADVQDGVRSEFELMPDERHTG